MIIAMWMVHGETYREMQLEAESDAEIFGIDYKHDVNYNVDVYKCTPAKIEEHRVVTWKGWAVVLWGTLDSQLLLNAIQVEEALLNAVRSSGLSQLGSR